MKARKTFCVAAAATVVSLFFAFGCMKRAGLPKPEGLIPDSVGKFSLKNAEDGREAEYQNEKNLRQKFQSWDSTYADGENNIKYTAAIHKTAEDAINELNFLTGCYSTNRQLQLSKKIREKISLKDKSGKEAGLMAICLTPNSKANYEKKGLGDFDYVFSLSSGNQSYTVKSFPADKTAAIVEFIKSLPAVSQLDLSFLDSLGLSDSSAKSLTFDDMLKNPPPVKLAAKPYLKGKVLVLRQNHLDGEQSAPSFGNETEGYIKDAGMQAMFPGEVGSIVRIECRKGNKVGVYSAGEGKQLPAFGSTCEAMIIDNSIPAIIARKTFTNNELAEVTMLKTNKNGELTDKQYVLPYPVTEIQSFIDESLPKK